MTEGIAMDSVIANRGLNSFFHDGHHGGYGGYGGHGGGHGYGGGYGGGMHGNFGYDGSVINNGVNRNSHQAFHSADNASRERDFMAANASRERDNAMAESRLQHADGRLENKLDRMNDQMNNQHTGILRELADSRVESVRDSLNGTISVNQQIATAAAAAAECCCENRVANAENRGAIAALSVSVNDLARDRSQDEILRAIDDLKRR